MFFILLLCLVPGSQSFTYNGINSTVTLKLENITTNLLSFDLQTRQQESFLFACYESSSRYFVVGIKDGNLSLHANYSGTVISLKGGGIVNDGERHRINIAHSSGNTSVTNNNGTPGIFPENILNDDWLKLLSNRTLVIGSDDSPFIKNLFSHFYFGGLTIKRIGQQLPNNESQYNQSNVKVGWHSSNPCTAAPCERGKCIDIFNAYRCECPQFYTNTHCNETRNVSCSFGNLCNNGTCINLTMAVRKEFSDNGRDYFKCNCSAGYEGFLCKNETNECVVNNCKNGGTCVDGHLQYSCLCTAGWTGANCTLNINDCQPNPCKNNGTCEDRTNGYECKCYEGRYQGKNCTEDFDECTRPTNDSCNTKGNCTNTLGGYSCSCRSGYYGDKCQYDSSAYCTNASPCINGNCTTQGIGYNCTCDRGYIGNHCDQDYNECEELNPCKNNATCSDSHTDKNSTFVPGYRCTCTSEFSGVNCLTARSTSSSSDNTVVIIVAVVVVVVIIVISVLMLICYYKRNSGQQGTYKPNAEEQNVGAVAMEQIKKPNVERLI